MVFCCCCDLLFTSQPEEAPNIDAVIKTQQEFAQNLDSNSGGSNLFLFCPSLPFLRAEFWNLTNDCSADDGGGVRACLLRFALLSFAAVVVARLAASACSGCGRGCGGDHEHGQRF